MFTKHVFLNFLKERGTLSSKRSSVMNVQRYIHLLDKTQVRTASLVGRRERMRPIMKSGKLLNYHVLTITLMTVTGLLLLGRIFIVLTCRPTTSTRHGNRNRVHVKNNFLQNTIRCIVSSIKLKQYSKLELKQFCTQDSLTKSL